MKMGAKGLGRGYLGKKMDTAEKAQDDRKIQPL
jgi:hypothetical protein